MLVKTLDQESPQWLKAATMEVLRTLCAEPQLLRSFYLSYDLEHSSTKIFHETVNQMSKYVQTMFNPDDHIVMQATVTRCKWYIITH